MKEQAKPFEILLSGKIPDTENYKSYIDLYERGLKEIKDLFKNE